jgi:predicted lipoprotein
MPVQRRLITWGTVAALLAVALYFFPLFHIVPINQAEQHTDDAPFDPVAFVDRFWSDQLIPAAARAVDATELVAAVARDRQSARRTYGRSVGLGGVYYYFVAGAGRVASIEKDSVGLSLRDDQHEVQVSLATGNIFGNVVRDGTGLLDVNNFANSQDFNALSSEINRRIEEQVLPDLRKRAAVGAKVRFVGCVEIIDEQTDLRPLRVVPFVVELP